MINNKDNTSLADDSQEKAPDVRIHIDREIYTSKALTTGKALYELASLGSRKELFRSTTGEYEDEYIPDSTTLVRVYEDDHFYSQQEIVVIVNGRPKHTTETRLDFEEVIKLAFERPPVGENILFTITYRRGPRENPEGTLTQGHSVRTKKGMVFNVTATDKS